MHLPFCSEMLRSTRQEIKYSLMQEKKSTPSFYSQVEHCTWASSRPHWSSGWFSVQPQTVSFQDEEGRQYFEIQDNWKEYFKVKNAKEHSKSIQWRDVKSIRKRVYYCVPSISHWLKPHNPNSGLIPYLLPHSSQHTKKRAICSCSLIFLRLPFGKKTELTSAT